MGRVSADSGDLDFGPFFENSLSTRERPFGPQGAKTEAAWGKVPKNVSYNCFWQSSIHLDFPLQALGPLLPLNSDGGNG